MPSSTFKLCSVVERNQEIRYPESNGNGIRYVLSKFLVNKTYDVHDFDSVSIRFFREYTRPIQYSQMAEDMLKAHNIEYKVEMCKSCGGLKKTIRFKVFEFND